MINVLEWAEFVTTMTSRYSKQKISKSLCNLSWSISMGVDIECFICHFLDNPKLSLIQPRQLLCR